MPGQHMQAGSLIYDKTDECVHDRVSLLSKIQMFDFAAASATMYSTKYCSDTSQILFYCCVHRRYLGTAPSGSTGP